MKNWSGVRHTFVKRLFYCLFVHFYIFIKEKTNRATLLPIIKLITIQWLYKNPQKSNALSALLLLYSLQNNYSDFDYNTHFIWWKGIFVLPFFHLFSNNSNITITMHRLFVTSSPPFVSDTRSNAKNTHFWTNINPISIRVQFNSLLWCIWIHFSLFFCMKK